VITGVSGSGKSSLAMDTLLVEARRRYLASVAFGAAQRLGRLGRAQAESISGLRVAAALDQAAPAANPRSTVGTLTGIYGLLRLLLARVGRLHCAVCGALAGGSRCGSCGAGLPVLEARLLSFNVPQGACPGCAGLGLQERVDPELLVKDARLSLRQGALVPTTPKGYIVYSQVTMEVLDTVCRAHGFSVDQPWGELDDEQRRVVLHGSDRIIVPFGKHPLESRLRWKGITARPRQEGHYKGLVPTLEGILASKRNPGVLRFVRSVACEDCRGSRLRPEARALKLGGLGAHEWSALALERLPGALARQRLDERGRAVAAPILAELGQRCARLDELGLGHLSLQRATDSLSRGEARRLRLASCLAGGLGGMLYLLDEPSAGLHPAELPALEGVLRQLVAQGNTVLAVEHELELVRRADFVVDVGPGPGAAGGRLLYAGPVAEWSTQDGVESPTLAVMEAASQPLACDPGAGVAGPWLELRGADAHNLCWVDLSLPLGCLCALTGVSGAGKTTLALGTLVPALQRSLGLTGPPPLGFEVLEGGEPLAGVVVVDQDPIGRTPRSNAATYTKLFDRIRALFARLPLARQAGWTASRFSFNTRGGRCERCEGAGVVRVGMHFLSEVHLRCPDCGGARFDAATLAVRYRGLDVHQVLELSVDRALELFADRPAIARVLAALQLLGLGYLPLGQPATTLSGGEARRVKLAAHLARPARGPTLYVLDDPSTGLHAHDVAALVAALRQLVRAGHSVLVVDGDLDLLLAADHLVELGPGGGPRGGRVVASGPPAAVAAQAESATARALAARLAGASGEILPAAPVCATRPIRLRGARTHNLQGVDLDLPAGALTVVTGVSGSGKSSLVFDTLHAEAWRRLAATLPSEARRRLARLPAPQLSSCEGLGPPVAVGQRPVGRNPRSTVGTAAGVLVLLRLLYARFGQQRCPDCGVALEERHCPGCGRAGPGPLLAERLSFNDQAGGCRACGGLGAVTRCDPERLVSHPERSLWRGALAGSKLGRHLGEPDGQHLATLDAVAEGLGLELRRPWQRLHPEARRVVLEGTGERIWKVSWRFQRGQRRGEHLFERSWPGLLSLVEDEWDKLHADRRAAELRPLLREQPCSRCEGERLAPWPRAVRFAGLRLGQLCAEPVDELLARVERWRACPPGGELSTVQRAGSGELLLLLAERLAALARLGLGYLALDRATDSLSGGEARRLQLAGLLAGELSGLLCVLDEPTLGLHAGDVQALLEATRALVERGNTVVVVEHDPAVVAAADLVVELGPGPGAQGGRVVAAGSPAALREHPGSLTGAWLRGERSLPARDPGSLDGAPIRLRGARCHNLHGLDLDLPTGGLLGLCGVSGSGKSTLVREVLLASAQQGRAVRCDRLEGLDQFERTVLADASPLGSASTSTPASYAGLMDPLRRLYARSERARELGFGAAHFTYAGPRGRCPACKGSGRERVSMELVADVSLSCPVCDGDRYRPEVLAVRVNGISIAQALRLPVQQAAGVFSAEPKLAERLATLVDLGLGYLGLGQPCATLSGGEARRLRLAVDLLDGAGEGRRLYLLDEPTAGLHPQDVARLLQVLDRLVRQGHTVLLVEHDLQLLVCCDWLVELGPVGGPAGGRLVAQGRPAELAARAGSPTGAALRAARLG